ncbi:MAG: type II toxin-antitoxin system ParD family antitoxin [Bacteroidota bacterium]|jgi:antitoxin ParD1/3/4
MTTMNISIPESMRQYIEEQSAAGEFTTSEYIRHLIRMDQEEKKREKRFQLAQYLALCEEQIARGEVSTPDFDDIVALSRSMQKKSNRKRS